MDDVIRAIKVFFIKIGHSLGICRTKPSRLGWDKQFQAMARRGEDQLLDELMPIRWGRSEWKW